MEPVAARDEIADQFVLGAGVPVAEPRPCGLDVVNADICRFPDNRAVSGQASGDQVLCHLGLAVDGDGLAGQFAEVDANAPAANGDLGAVMHQPFAVQAPGDACLFQQRNRSLLQHACANASLDIVERPRFQNDALDAMDLQQAGEQKPCRPGSDDAHLGTLALRHVPDPFDHPS